MTTKRISFDRSEQVEITNIVAQIIRDKERLEDGWERVYTNPSIIDLDNAPAKFRFGTGGEDRQKWHQEEPAPVADTIYCVCEEFHCRGHDRGIFGVYIATLHDRIMVVWHGYDKLIRER